MALEHRYHFFYPARQVYQCYASREFIEGRFLESGLPSPRVEATETPTGVRITAKLDIGHQLGKVRYLLKPMGLANLVLDYEIEWHIHSDRHMNAAYRYSPVGLDMALTGTLVVREDTPGQSVLEHEAHWHGPLSGRLHHWIEDLLVKRVHKEFGADMTALEGRLAGAGEHDTRSAGGV